MALLIWIKSMDYFVPNFKEGFLIGKESIYPFYKWLLYVHMLFGPLALLLGSLQMMMPKKSNIHQYLGKIYVYAILFFAAPAGLLMSFWAMHGIVPQVSFALLSLLWMLYTFKGYKGVTLNNIQMHKKWIIGSYVLSTAAVSLRILLLLNNIFEITDPITAYQWISVLCWLPFILVYEGLLLLRTKL